MAKLTSSQVLDAIEAQERAALGSHHGLSPSQVLDELQVEGVLDDLETKNRNVSATTAATQHDPGTQPTSTPWAKRLRSDSHGSIEDLTISPRAEPRAANTAAFTDTRDAAADEVRPPAKQRLRRLK